MFVKEKHTGQIKGRGFAVWSNMQKEDTSSPTVAVESLRI